MILFVNPRATRPKNRRFPLSVMAIGAAVPAGESWHIIDGNLPNSDPLALPLRARRGVVDTQAYGHLRQAAPAVP